MIIGTPPLVTQQDDTRQRYAKVLWVSLIGYIPEYSTQGVPMWYPSTTQAPPSATSVVSKWYPSGPKITTAKGKNNTNVSAVSARFSVPKWYPSGTHVVLTGT